MRPIKLKMCAFGPYKDLVCIDFDKLGSNGIFLITGDTGSGKTTIFDAISFALFGVSSGSRRENNTLRSDFANDEVKTLVELEFIHKGILYKVERSPKYTRKKVRGDGTTIVGGDATLTYLDKVITGDKNVSDECIEILGINANQFKQIVMIAQGEFMELLLSKPKDRAVIFRKIFDTEIFKNISDNLKEKYLNKLRKYKDEILTLNNYKNSISWDKEIEENISTSSLLELLESYNTDIKNEKNSLEKEKSLLEKDFELLVKEISEGNLINESLNNLEIFKQKYEELINERDTYIEKQNIFNKNKEIKNKLIPKKEQLDIFENKINEIIVEKENNLKLLEECDEKFNEISLKYNDISNLEVKKNDLIKTKDDYNLKLKIFDEIENLNKTLDFKNNIMELIKLNDKKVLLNKFEELNKSTDTLKEKEKQFILLSKEFKKMNDEYLDFYERFLNSQAGIIASTLKDNCPCPVCGSLEHPNIAVVSEEVLSREELNKLKLEVDVTSDELEELSMLIGLLKKDVDVIGKELCDYDYESLLNKVNDIENNINLIDVDLSNYNADILSKEIYFVNSLLEEKKSKVLDIDINQVISMINELNTEIDNINNEIKNVNEYYNKIAIEREKLNVLIDSLDKELNKLDVEYKEGYKEYKDCYKELGYSSEDEYLSILLDDDELNKIEKDISKYNASVLEFKSKISSLEDFLVNKNKVDVTNLSDKKNILEEKISKLDVTLKELYSKLFNNLKIFDSIKSVYKRSVNLENEVMVLKDLSDTSNGAIVGKNKLEFEQFVQASYFDMVVMSANKRFSYMTDERYLLARKEEAVKISDKLGLELEVIDNYTGKRRDVKSLSGGESFKAALSLALGMSDTIQNYSGGIVVDAMFIDEGFGSLDDESLEQAMNAIMMLGQNDKIIGIISHVNELKARIDKKIVVKKSNTGSCVEILI